MSISSALSNANSGLTAAARRTDLVSSNIANALTPGYARRDISVSERVMNGAGAGVSVNGVSRAGDPVLTRERRVAEGALGRDQALASSYVTLNKALGDPEDAYSLVGRYQNFEAALRNLADTPESVAHQAAALDASLSLASTFNDLSSQAQNARKDADSQIARQVETVNDALKQIEKLNGDIRKAGLGGRDTSALEDQRKMLIDDVSAIIPVREVPAGHGAVDLMTHEGVFLLAGKAHEISFTRAGTITHDAAYDGGAGVLSGLSVNGIDITPGGASSQAVRQGSLAGHFAVRDEVMPQFQAKIDALAADLIARMEGVDGSLAPGAAGLFTDAGDALDPASTNGLAARIAVNAAVNPAAGGELWRLRDGLGAGAPGPASNAGLIRDLLDSFTAQRAPGAGSGLSGDMSAAEMAAGVTSLIGAARLSAETAQASSAARADAVIEAEASISGVDSDQELQKLILIEQAYAANARVIQTAHEMIRTLMEL